MKPFAPRELWGFVFRYLPALLRPHVSQAFAADVRSGGMTIVAPCFVTSTARRSQSVACSSAGFAVDIVVAKGRRLGLSSTNASETTSTASFARRTSNVVLAKPLARTTQAAMTVPSFAPWQSRSACLLDVPE